MSAWRRAPLRFRLVASMVGLATLGLVVSGVVGARLLRGYLLDRVDQQLETASLLLAEGPISEEQAAQLPSPFHVSVYAPDGSLFGVLWTPLQDRRASPVTPDSLTPDQAQASGGRPFTIDDAVHHGSWRAVAQPLEWPGPPGSRPGVGTVLVATNLGEVDATVDRMQHIAMLVGLAVLAGLAIAGYGIVRTALRPLTEIERTAAAITRGDLTRRVPDADPATEVGRVGRGLNTMLDHLEEAFDAREASEATARRSEARMRQFIADASHELRTPLTSIRGFAELYRQPAMTDRAAIADALRRIEDEAKRMGLLVDDLLLLARLDQQRPFATDPVDLATVARDAAEAARVVAPDHPITFVGPSAPAAASTDTEVDAGAGPGATGAVDAGTTTATSTSAIGAGAPADASDTIGTGAGAGASGTLGIGTGDDASGTDTTAAAGSTIGTGAGDGERVMVAGDDVRLRQLATNLVDNAVRHTPAATPIEVRVSVVEGDAPGGATGRADHRDRGNGHGRRWAELAVTDQGPGLSPEQAARVFERFYRTDTARSRKGPSGAGLGLSIVMAIAVAHGGLAMVDTAPGKGATFRVRLPLLTTPPPGCEPDPPAAARADKAVLPDKT